MSAAENWEKLEIFWVFVVFLGLGWKKQKVPLFSQVDKKREFTKFGGKESFPPCLKVVHQASSSVFWKLSHVYTFVWKSVLFPTTFTCFFDPLSW